MRPALFRWRGIELLPYPTMLFAGMVAGALVGVAIAPELGLPQSRTYAAILLLLAPAVIGARLLYVAEHWPAFRGNLARIWRRSDGGLALYGGLVLAVLTSLPLLRALSLPFAAFWDAGAVVILVGMAFTKVGCHLNGCCAGKPSTGRFALRLPNERGVVARRFPSQLAEGAVAAALALLALAIRNRLPFHGAIFVSALFSYGVARFWLESTRETVDRVGATSVNRFISATVAIASLVALAAAWYRR